jgi:hypothetical protein
MDGEILQIVIRALDYTNNKFNPTLFVVNLINARVPSVFANLRPYMIQLHIHFLANA